MQLLESSPFGVRANRISLRSSDSAVEVTLFPMLHVGEPAFYKVVFDDAFSHDVVLTEGVRSPITKRITRSYRWIEGSSRVNLVVQPPYPTAESCAARIIRADLSAEEFEEACREVPLWLRAAANMVSPIIGLNRRWFGSRESVAKGMSLDDQASQKELINLSPEGAALTRAILDIRDDRLIARLGEQIDNAASGTERLAVVYGAMHMRAVLRELTTHRKYRPIRGDWLTVFSLYTE